MADATTLAAAIGGPLVGLAGVTFAYLNGKQERGQARVLAHGQRRHERDLAHDARLHESRGKVYEELLAFGHRNMLAVERTYPSGGPAWGEPPGMLPDEDYVQLQARVAAFGSRDVLDALDGFNARVRAFFARANAFREQKGQIDLTDIESLRRDVRQSLRAMEASARSELTAPPGQRSAGDPQ